MKKKEPEDTKIEIPKTGVESYIILGAVILVGTEEDELINELDVNSVKIATSFLGKYLEG